MSKTKYKILRRNEDGSWDEFDEEFDVEATSPTGAIRAALTDSPLNGSKKVATFVAIPLRSWKPKPVEVETQQRLKIG